MMELEAAYPVVVTEKLAECRDFYIRRLGFQVARGRVLGPVHAVSGGVRLSVLERGDGPPLLLVAGIPAVASDWEPVVRRLSARRRRHPPLLAPTARGGSRFRARDRRLDGCG